MTAKTVALSRKDLGLNFAKRTIGFIYSETSEIRVFNDFYPK